MKNTCNAASSPRILIVVDDQEKTPKSKYGV